MNRKSLLQLTTAAVAVCLSALAANATSLTVNSISGAWSSANPASAVGGVGSSTIEWGTPESGGLKSSYSFAAAPAFTANVGDSFALGDFVHNNYRITGTSLSEAVLDVTFGFSIGTNSYSLTNQYNFEHWETGNSNPCPAGSTLTICDDRVRATLNNATAQTVNVGGTEYTFNIEGFTVGGSLLSEFWTGENRSNTAELTGSFSAYTPAPVPLPAAGFLLIGGLGGLAAIGRRRTKAA